MPRHEFPRRSETLNNSEASSSYQQHLYEPASYDAQPQSSDFTPTRGEHQETSFIQQPVESPEEVFQYDASPEGQAVALRNSIRHVLSSDSNHFQDLLQNPFQTHIAERVRDLTSRESNLAGRINAEMREIGRVYRRSLTKETDETKRRELRVEFEAKRIEALDRIVDEVFGG